MTPLSTYAADHKFLVRAAAEAAGLTDPVAFNAGGSGCRPAGTAKRDPREPRDGALVRQWPTRAKYYPNTTFGVRVYTLEGIQCARCVAYIDHNYDQNGYDIF